MTPLLLLVLLGTVEGGNVAGCKILDLTHLLDERTPYYPVYKPFKLEAGHAGQTILPGRLRRFSPGTLQEYNPAILNRTRRREASVLERQ